MWLFGSRKSKVKTYDHDTQEPVIRASICNGEQVAGFRDIKTGRFEEILYIRKPSDIDAFKAEYGIEGEIRKEYGGIPIWLDVSMKRFDHVHPAGGNEYTSVKLTPDELEKASKAVGWCDVCKGWESEDGSTIGHFSILAQLNAVDVVVIEKEKKKSEEASSRYNDMLNYGLDNSEGDDYGNVGLGRSYIKGSEAEWDIQEICTGAEGSDRGAQAAEKKLERKLAKIKNLAQ